MLTLNFIVKSVGWEFTPALICISFKCVRTHARVAKPKQIALAQAQYENYMLLRRSKNGESLHIVSIMRHGALREHIVSFNCVKFTSSNIKE